jgi:hypothetical protein
MELSLLVVAIDHIMQDMNISSNSKSLDKYLPVIRIFGSTDEGKRICVNVHGVSL